MCMCLYYLPKIIDVKIKEFCIFVMMPKAYCHNKKNEPVSCQNRIDNYEPSVYLPVKLNKSEIIFDLIFKSSGESLNSERNVLFYMDPITTL